jgi:hypothetical protein
MNEPNLKPEPMEHSMAERWEAVAPPGSEATGKCFDDYLKSCGAHRRIQNCAIPLTCALELT